MSLTLREIFTKYLPYYLNCNANCVFILLETQFVLFPLLLDIFNLWELPETVEYRNMKTYSKEKILRMEFAHLQLIFINYGKYLETNMKFAKEYQFI